MKKAELFRVAGKLGIDVKSVISPDAPRTDQTNIDSPYGFRGQIEFDFEISLLGKTVHRKARINYEYTPDWAYFDPVAGHERLEMQSSAISIDVEAIYEHEAWETVNGTSRKRAHTREWFGLDITGDGILSDEVWEEIDRLIEARCRAENAARLAKVGSVSAKRN